MYCSWNQFHNSAISGLVAGKSHVASKNMSVEYNLVIPLHETIQKGIKITTKLRVLGNHKEIMLSVSDLGERERLAAGLEGLWVDVENVCTSKFSFVVSLTALGRQKWNNLRRPVDHAIEVLMYSTECHCELWHDYISGKCAYDSYEDYCEFLCKWCSVYERKCPFAPLENMKVSAINCNIVMAFAWIEYRTQS